MSFKTPQPEKRPNTEMTFSPEGTDQTSLMAMMSKLFEEKFDQQSALLEEKFNQLFQPLKDDLSNLKENLYQDREKNQKRIGGLQREVDELKQENSSLKKHIDKVEGFQRRNNLRISGIKENKGENLDLSVINLFNEFLSADYKLTFHTLE